MAFRRWFLLAGALLGALIVDGCGSSVEDAAPASNPCSRCGDAMPTDAAPDTTLDVGTPDQHPAEDGGVHNPLCGPGCDPDDPNVCTDGAALAAGDAALDAPSDAAAPDAEAGPRDSGSTRDAEPPAHACQVRRTRAGRAASCGAAGTGDSGKPCVTSADCAPGLACIGDSEAALCRPYCCRGSEGGDASDEAGASRCEDGEYCADRPLRDDADSAAPLRVPVCVPAERCRLDDPYPCPANLVCACAAGTACTVVRSDGTTGCLRPGPGVLGQACPCAPGFFCHAVTDKCVKLCSTTVKDFCGRGICQSVAGLPKDWGVCVGAMDGG